MNPDLAQTLRRRLDSARVEVDADFYTFGPSAALLSAMTDEPMHVSCAQYVRDHSDPERLALDGLRVVEQLYETAVGEDLSLAVTLTQQWALLLPAMSREIEKARGGKKRGGKTGSAFPARVWGALENLELLATECDLDDDAARAIETWRRSSALEDDQLIAGVAIVMTSLERAIVTDVFGASAESSSHADIVSLDEQRGLVMQAPMEDFAEESTAEYALAAKHGTPQVSFQHTCFEGSSGPIRVQGQISLEKGRLLASVDTEEQARAVQFIAVGNRFFDRVGATTFALSLGDDEPERGPFVVVVSFEDGARLRRRLGRA